MVLGMEEVTTKTSGRKLRVGTPIPPETDSVEIGMDHPEDATHMPDGFRCAHDEGKTTGRGLES